jgi:hypothetical protein
VRERKKLKKKQRKAAFKKILQRKNRRRRKEEKSNASREQGSGPSEDRVGENTGTNVLLFTTLFFIPRSFVRSFVSLSLSLLFSFFCVSVCLRRRCNNNNNNKMRSEKTEISLLSERILKCV